jgi:hypothetical protein
VTALVQQLAAELCGDSRRNNVVRHDERAALVWQAASVRMSVLFSDGDIKAMLGAVSGPVTGLWCTKGTACGETHDWYASE